MAEFAFNDEDCEDIPVTITKKDGTKVELVLREPDTAGSEEYQAATLKRLETGGNGQYMMRDLTGLSALLLTKCLFHRDTNKPVTVKEVQAWPPRRVKKLFEKAKELAGLDDAAEETAKNG